MTTDSSFPPSLAQGLVQDELLDLTLYQRLEPLAGEPLKTILKKLIVVETGHLHFWEQFFHISSPTLSSGRRAKLWLLMFSVRIFGDHAIHLILESIEVFGIKKYLIVWEHYRDTSLGEAVKHVLQDELEHEETILSAELERRISSEKIGNIFLGFNDGLVEILGAVSGFFAAFSSPISVLIAALTVSVAGAISMAAGVYVSSGSEKEVADTEVRRQQFLGTAVHSASEGDGLLGGAVVVGISYFLGSLVPILPVVFGARNVFISAFVSFVMIAVVSFVLSFLSGMDIRHRIRTNVIVIAIAIGSTALIGTLARLWFGVAL